MIDEKIPTILDTDIGTDIDDTWALAQLLKSPELDLRLITASTGSPRYRAKLVCKMLETAGRTDVVVALGEPIPEQEHDIGRKSQAAWIEDYELSAFPGTLLEDGARAIVDFANDAGEITLVAIGPLTTIAKALEIDSDFAAKVNLIGMLGSVRKGHFSQPPPIPEYNVAADAEAAKKVFSASWKSMKITPLDTCGNIFLENERYQSVKNSDDTVMKAVMDNFRIWAPGWKVEKDYDNRSTCLFDTVAAYMAYDSGLLEFEKMGIEVTEDGRTVESSGGRRIDVAVKWKNFNGFLDHLVERLLSPTLPPPT